MTPRARLSAAMALLDEILAGEPAERGLTRWARASRFAGSKDRAAVRDIVFDGLRRRASLGYLGGGDTGRAIVLGHAWSEGLGLDEIFTGEVFAPAPLTGAERASLAADLASQPPHIRLDYPEFLHNELTASLGADCAPVLEAMRTRAPVDLRVNSLKTTVNAAIVVLARDAVRTTPMDLVPNALRVIENPRLVAASRAYTQGIVELQDLSSQFVAAQACARPGMTVLDYCAGGGGKTLALAASMQRQGRLLAYDINTARMRDLPERARRAGATVEILDAAGLAPLRGRCDLVMVDAPCSGTGAWRRKPDGKWRLTPEALAAFAPLQDGILAEAAAYVRPGGALVYATCSLLGLENEDRAARFAREHPAWTQSGQHRLTPLDGGDGFFCVRFQAPRSRATPRKSASSATIN